MRERKNCVHLGRKEIKRLRYALKQILRLLKPGRITEVAVPKEKQKQNARNYAAAHPNDPDLYRFIRSETMDR